MYVRSYVSSTVHRESLLHHNGTNHGCGQKKTDQIQAAKERPDDVCETSSLEASIL